MPSHPHCHWRDGQAWKSYGLEMSTPSDEACKMFDASLTQMVNHFDDPVTGGLPKCMGKMLEADPDFVLGHAFTNFLSGKKIATDPKFAQDVFKMMELSQRPGVKSWERKHALAVKYYAEGFEQKAAETWEDILVEKPRDMLALLALHDIYILNGCSQGLRDSTGGALPHWSSSMPMYGNLLGMHAFGLEETNMYDVAEKTARKALEINPYDSWASHCVAHVNEMTGRFKEGSKFMEETENTWNDSTLQCHNYWHWALFHYEAMDLEAALGIVDNYVLPYLQKNKSFFPLTDAATAMFRLESQGMDMGSRWNDCLPIAKMHTGNKMYSYLDLSIMLTFMGAEQLEEGDRLVETIRDYSRNGTGDKAVEYKEVTLRMMEAFQSYASGDYGKTIEQLMPLKYQAFRIGGSHAQREIVKLFTISAAMKSEDPSHQNYARHLVDQRKMLKGETPLIKSMFKELDARE